MEKLEIIESSKNNNSKKKTQPVDTQKESKIISEVDQFQERVKRRLEKI